MYTQTKRNTLAFTLVVLASTIALAFAMPASAFWFGGSSGDDNDIKVSVSNSANVTNHVDTDAKTGGNEADGGDGEEGGNGGDAEGDGDNTGGNGGNGGSGALGGYIVSGDALAASYVSNDVNTVKTRVTDSCGCDDDRPSFMDLFSRRSNDGDDNDIRVRVSNNATVMNDVDTDAKTGGNEAEGGDGEEGGNGGDAENRSHHSRMMMPFLSFWSSDDNVGGNGGTGGSGGIGGEIYSGNATSGSEVVNVVNRTVTRVTR